jgi:hypothetical protein
MAVACGDGVCLFRNYEQGEKNEENGNLSIDGHTTGNALRS